MTSGVNAEVRTGARITRRSILILGLQGLGLGLGYLLQVVLARLMGPSEYGLFAYVLSWGMTFALLSSLGLPAAAVRFVPELISAGDRPQAAAYVRDSTRLVMLAGIAIAAAATAAILLMSQMGLLDRVGLPILVAWSIPIFNVLRMQTEVLRSTGRLVLAFVPVLTLRPFLVAGAAGLMFVVGGGLPAEGALAATAVAAVLIVTARVRPVTAATAGEGCAIRSKSAQKEWLGVSLPLLATAFFIFILGESDILMIGAIRDTTSVGFYRAASRTASLIALALTAVNTVTAPMVSALNGSGSRNELVVIVRRAVHLIFWPSAGLAALVVVAAEPILGVFGPDFVFAAPALRILALGHLINAITGPVGYLLDLTGHQQISMKIYGASAALNIALNAWAIHVLDWRGPP